MSKKKGLTTAEIAEIDSIARMVSAAPEMLTALRGAENALADYIPQLERRGASLNYGRSVLTLVRAAIKKATTGKARRHD